LEVERREEELVQVATTKQETPASKQPSKATKQTRHKTAHNVIAAVG